MRLRAPRAHVAVAAAALAILSGCRLAGVPQVIPQFGSPSQAEQQRYATAESQLHSPDAVTRESAALSLLSMDHPDALDAVVQAIRSGEPAVSVSAVRAAAFCEDGRCFDALLGAVGNPDASVRSAAADALACFSESRQVGAIVEYVADPTTPAETRRLLYRALGEGLAMRSVPVLLDGIERGDQTSRIAAWEALKRISARDLPLEPAPWRAWWRANSHRTREDVLEEHLRVAEAEVAERARGLADLQEQHEQLIELVTRSYADSIEPLVAALGSRYPVVRRYAAYQIAELPDERLGELSLDGQDLYLLLRGALSDESPDVRLNALRIILRLTGAYRDRLVAKALLDDDPAVLVRALEAVGATTGPQVLERLHDLVAQSAAPEVRAAAANALGKVGTLDSAPVLAAALGDTDENVRWFAVEGLRKLGAVEAVPSISRVVQEDESARVRAVAALALGALGQPAGVPALRQALRDPAENVRQNAVQALVSLAQGGPERMMVIARILQEQGLLAESRGVLERLVALHEGDGIEPAQLAEARMQLAAILEQQGDAAGAVGQYLQLEDEGLGSAESRRRLVGQWLGQGERQQAVEALRGWLAAGADGEVAALAVETAERLAQENHAQEAGDLLTALDAASAASSDPALGERLGHLRALLAPGGEPAPPGT